MSIYHHILLIDFVIFLPFLLIVNQADTFLCILNEYKCVVDDSGIIWDHRGDRIFQSTWAGFHLTLATLVESFHPCYLSNVKQRQMMLASVASIKWNAAIVAYNT